MKIMPCFLDLRCEGSMEYPVVSVCPFVRSFSSEPLKEIFWFFCMKLWCPIGERAGFLKNMSFWMFLSKIVQNVIFQVLWKIGSKYFSNFLHEVAATRRVKIKFYEKLKHGTFQISSMKLQQHRGFILFILFDFIWFLFCVCVCVCVFFFFWSGRGIFM